MQPDPSTLREALEGARLAIQEDDQEDALAFIAAAAAAAPDLSAFLGEPTTENWPAIDENFYRDPETAEWVYRYADERLVLAEREAGRG